ncbi:MAG: hypothetical protein FWG57_01510 [Endomicrobia bacterium]|nr:hypothetical protein [Endomicrobiia bacterium]
MKLLKRKGLIIALLGILLVFAIPLGINVAHRVTQDRLKAALNAEQAKAYFMIFEDFDRHRQTEYITNKYIAVDLTNVKLPDTAPLIALMQNYCDRHGLTLFLDTSAELIKKGYIYTTSNGSRFVNVSFFKFVDTELTQDTLVTLVSMWSGYADMSGIYTAKRTNNMWEITGGQAALNAEQAKAYFMIFEDFYRRGGGRVAVDLTNVKLPDTALLIKLMQNHFDRYGGTLLLDTFEGLVEKGYIIADRATINGSRFVNVSFFKFVDTELTQDTLVTWSSMRSSYAEKSGTYTVKRTNNVWEITNSNPVGRVLIID